MAKFCQIWLHCLPTYLPTLVLSAPLAVTVLRFHEIALTTKTNNLNWPCGLLLFIFYSANLISTNFSPTTKWLHPNITYLGSMGYLSFYFKNGHPRTLFHLFSVMSNKYDKFYNNTMWKMSIQYLVMRFKPTTSWTQVSSHNHLTRVATLGQSFYLVTKLFLFSMPVRNLLMQ